MYARFGTAYMRLGLTTHTRTHTHTHVAAKTDNHDHVLGTAHKLKPSSAPTHSSSTTTRLYMCVKGNLARNLN